MGSQCRSRVIIAAQIVARSPRLRAAAMRRRSPARVSHAAFFAKEATVSTPASRSRVWWPTRILCSMSCSANIWDNAAMESFFSSLKTERTGDKIYRTRDDARADVFDYIERF